MKQYSHINNKAKYRYIRDYIGYAIYLVFIAQYLIYIAMAVLRPIYNYPMSHLIGIGRHRVARKYFTKRPNGV